MLGPTPLCEIANKYGADKSPDINHNYTPFYYSILNDKRHEVKKVLEFGIGNRRIYHAIPTYQMGARLRMWRDFFPNAQIYGADIVKESQFEDDRIKTFICNELVKEDVENLIKEIGSDIDIVIDDASHHIGDQKMLLENLMPLLNKDVTYIIEDCLRTKVIRNEYPQYDSFIPGLIPNDRPRMHEGIIILTKKK